MNAGTLMMAAVALLAACAPEPGREAVVAEAVDGGVDGDSLTVAADAGPEVADDASDRCAALCRKGEGVPCPAPDGCQQQCQAALVDRCGAAWRAWTDCALTQPDSAFQCGAGGVRQLGPNACTDAQHAYADCILWGT